MTLFVIEGANISTTTIFRICLADIFWLVQFAHYGIFRATCAIMDISHIAFWTKGMGSGCALCTSFTGDRVGLGAYLT